jgi:hypothetical protein
MHTRPKQIIVCLGLLISYPEEKVRSRSEYTSALNNNLVPIILAISLVFLNKHSLGTSACPICPMQKKKILITFT